MRNEKQKLQSIKEYFQSQLPGGIRVVEKNTILIIDVPIVNIRTAGLAFLFIMLVIISAKVDFSFYFLPLLAAFIVIIGLFWAEMNLLNNVILDLKKKTLQIQSNNFIKRLLLRLSKSEITISFNDIARVTLSQKWEMNILDRYYLIEIVLRNQKRIKLFYTMNNEPSIKAVDLLRTAMKSQ